MTSLSSGFNSIFKIAFLMSATNATVFSLNRHSTSNSFGLRLDPRSKNVSRLKFFANVADALKTIRTLFDVLSSLITG